MNLKTSRGRSNGDNVRGGIPGAPLSIFITLFTDYIKPTEVQEAARRVITPSLLHCHAPPNGNNHRHHNNGQNKGGRRYPPPRAVFLFPTQRGGVCVHLLVLPILDAVRRYCSISFNSSGGVTWDQLNQISSSSEWAVTWDINWNLSERAARSAAGLGIPHKWPDVTANTWWDTGTWIKLRHVNLLCDVWLMNWTKCYSTPLLIVLLSLFSIQWGGTPDLLIVLLSLFSTQWGGTHLLIVLCNYTVRDKTLPMFFLYVKCVE